jgi:hypothetical protein
MSENFPVGFPRLRNPQPRQWNILCVKTTLNQNVTSVTLSSILRDDQSQILNRVSTSQTHTKKYLLFIFQSDYLSLQTRFIYIVIIYHCHSQRQCSHAKVTLSYKLIYTHAMKTAVAAGQVVKIQRLSATTIADSQNRLN